MVVRAFVLGIAALAGSLVGSSARASPEEMPMLAGRLMLVRVQRSLDCGGPSGACVTLGVEQVAVVGLMGSGESVELTGQSCSQSCSGETCPSSHCGQTNCGDTCASTYCGQTTCSTTNCATTGCGYTCDSATQCGSTDCGVTCSTTVCVSTMCGITGP